MTCVYIFQATRSGGSVALVGVGPSDITLPVLDAAVREIDIRGVFGYANCFSTALDMVATGTCLTILNYFHFYYQLSNTAAITQVYQSSSTSWKVTIRARGINCFPDDFMLKF